MSSFKIDLIRNHQYGMGLVEVLVALLLLAVAALGYTALQTRAVGTTDEAIVRTQAQTLLRDFAERIRTTGTSDAILNVYQAQLAITQPATAACTATSTQVECIAKDVAALQLQAAEVGVKLGMVPCPGTAAQANTRCLIAAWNDTTATVGATNKDCMNATGTYIFNADCVYMEAY